MCPRPLRLFALLSLFGTRPSRNVTTTGDARTFPSVLLSLPRLCGLVVARVVWESAGGPSRDVGCANVSAGTRALCAGSGSATSNSRVAMEVGTLRRGIHDRFEPHQRSQEQCRLLRRRFFGAVSTDCGTTSWKASVAATRLLRLHTQYLDWFDIGYISCDSLWRPFVFRSHLFRD